MPATVLLMLARVDAVADAMQWLYHVVVDEVVLYDVFVFGHGFACF